MGNEKLLEEVICDQLEDIKTTAPGSDEYKRKTEDMVKMMDRAIEYRKIENEAKEKEAELEIEKNDRMMRNGITLFSVLSGIGVTVWGAKKSWKFEEIGTVTSQAGREFVKGAVNFFKRK